MKNNLFKWGNWFLPLSMHLVWQPKGKALGYKERGRSSQEKQGWGWGYIMKKETNGNSWRNLRTTTWRETTAPLTEWLFAAVQITARTGRPRGESTFLHLIVRPWNPVPLFQMASGADWAGPSSVDPPSHLICPTQATKSLLAANIWDWEFNPNPPLETSLLGLGLYLANTIGQRLPKEHMSQCNTATLGVKVKCCKLNRIY